MSKHFFLIKITEYVCLIILSDDFDLIKMVKVLCAKDVCCSFSYKRYLSDKNVKIFLSKKYLNFYVTKLSDDFFCLIKCV